MATGTWQIYGKAALAIANGTLNLGSGTFNIALAASAYAPDKHADDFFNDVGTPRSGTNWAAAGAPVTLTFSQITGTSRVAIIPTDVSVPTVTLTDGKHAILYKVLGGASSADPLIAYLTFDTALAPTAGTLAIDNDNTNGAVYYGY
jgi:hypothetical protein